MCHRVSLCVLGVSVNMRQQCIQQCVCVCHAAMQVFVSWRIVVVSAISVIRKHVLELLHTVNKVASYAAAVTSVQQCQRVCQHAYTGCRRSKIALRKANTVVVCVKSKTRKLRKQEQELSVCFQQVTNSVERMSACHSSSIREHNVITQGKTLLVHVKSKTRKLNKQRAGAVWMLP